MNINGSYNLAFHNQHDIAELKHLFSDLDIQINEIIPEGTSAHQLKNLSKAWFNFVPYRKIGLLTAQFLEKEFCMPYINIAPIGITQIACFIRKIQKILMLILKIILIYKHALFHSLLGFHVLLIVKI